MPYLQAQRRCRLCGRKTLHQRETFSDAIGCVLTVLTCGLFLPVWVLVKILEGLTRRWVCQRCGSGRVT